MRYEHYDQRWEGQVVDLWNRCCAFDAIDVGKFRRQALFDDNFDPELSWVALEDERVLGFAFGTKRKFPYLERGLEPERGWVNVIFVAPEARRRGVASELLGRIETELRDRGVTNITLGAYSPSYFFAGVDPDNYPEAVAFFEDYVPLRAAWILDGFVKVDTDTLYVADVDALDGAETVYVVVLHQVQQRLSSRLDFCERELALQPGTGRIGFVRETSGRLDDVAQALAFAFQCVSAGIGDYTFNHDVLLLGVSGVLTYENFVERFEHEARLSLDDKAVLESKGVGFGDRFAAACRVCVANASRDVYLHDRRGIGETACL